MLSKGRLDRIRDIAGAVGIWPEEREAINDLLAELARLRPVVAAAEERNKREGECPICRRVWENRQVERHNDGCPLAALAGEGETVG